MISRNVWRYIMVILLAFLGGAASAAADKNVSIGDFMRHGLIASGPTIIALRMTLEREYGLKPAEDLKASAKSAGGE